MESILNLIVNAENVRMLVTLVFSFSCFVWLKISINSVHRRIDGVEYSLSKRIDNVEASLGKRIDELKYNDLALKGTIEALTFTLEKNGSMSKEDKEFVDSRFPVTV